MTGPLIQPDALADLVDSGSVALFDCRFDLADPAAGAAAFRAGHIPGAWYLDLDSDLSGPADGPDGRHPLPERSALVATLRAAGVRQGVQVVVYDDAGGAIAARAWWLLRWLGHDDVALLDGGWQAWSASGRALAAGEASPRPEGDFRERPPLVGTTGAAEIVDALGSDRLLVIDARTPERFAGEPHPLDAVAGHIPGARNRFYRDNLDDAGRFRPADELRAAFADVLRETPPDRAVLQCGSGVTACHDLLAMEIAGLAGARLYPGSWSGWIADPDRPVAGRR